jgi:hypothetical protein
MVKEIYLDITDYESLYQISNLGNVKSLLKKRNCGRHKNKFRIYDEILLKKQKDKRGYESVNLSKNGIQKRFLIHRLVSNTFIENKNGLPYVNHINGIKSDNNFLNLEWVTARENECHKQNQRKDKTSRFIGVSYDLISKKWKSQISLNGKKIGLGYFLNEEDAYNKRKEFEINNSIINKYT